MTTTTTSRRIGFVNLPAQYRSLKPEIDSAIHSVLERGQYIGGPELDDFERFFARYCGARHGLGVSSGTTALELVLRAVGAGPGSEVITVSHTFIASVAAISATGATPVLIDVDPDTGCMDPAKLEAAITERTRAVLPVHLYGHPAPVDRIQEIAGARDVVVIEDAAQAHGATLHGRRVGSLATAACFSFYPAKNLGAFGDGGFVTTDDDAIAAQLQLLRDHGRVSKYEHAVIGQTARLDNLQAAILGVQATKLDEWNERRRQVATWYRHHLASSPVALPVETDGARSVYHLFVVRSDRRDALREHLERRGVSTGVHYPIPVHLQPAYRHLDHRVGDFPVSERLSREVLSLPIHPFLEQADVEYVASSVAEFFA
jgi:dTDP-4-amino-4,6-dideoxygalactose transaminase